MKDYAIFCGLLVLAVFDCIPLAEGGPHCSMKWRHLHDSRNHFESKGMARETFKVEITWFKEGGAVDSHLLLRLDQSLEDQWTPAEYIYVHVV